jgi:hypothetical protein
MKTSAKLMVVVFGFAASLAVGCGGSDDNGGGTGSDEGGETGSGGKTSNGKGGSPGSGGHSATGGSGSGGDYAAGGSGSGGDLGAGGSGGALGTGGSDVDAAAPEDMAEPADMEPPDMMTPDAPPPVAPPAPWTTKDLGDVGTQVGWETLTTPVNDTQRIQVYAGGTGIGGMADSFHFVYRPVTGDAEMIGRMTTLAMQDSTLILDPAASAGLMIRDSLDPDSAMVYVGPVGDGKTGGHIVVRTKKGEAAVGTPADVTTPTTDIKAGNWIRMVRQGSTIQLYVGTRLQIYNGAGVIGSPTLTLTAKAGAPIYFGMAAAASNPMGKIAARFEDVMVNNLATNRATAGWSTQQFGETGGSVLWNADGLLAITALGQAWYQDPVKAREYFQYAFLQPPTTGAAAQASLQFLVTEQGMTNPGGRVTAAYRLPTGSDITKFSRSNAAVTLSVTQGMGLELSVRQLDGEKMLPVIAATVPALKAPIWLRIDRLMATESGDPLKNPFTEVRVYYAAYNAKRPGTPGTWTEVGDPVIFRNVGPADFATMGIGVSSYDVKATNTALISDISVTAVQAPPSVGFDGGVPDASPEADAGASD